MTIWESGAFAGALFRSPADRSANLKRPVMTSGAPQKKNS
jgi:hypothetical protein